MFSCKGCVTACHSLNGLNEGEIWRDVGALIGEEDSNPIQQTITSACHHCVDPACLNGCPVNAYEKDDTTGIVLHLDDQCIGCQYCVLKCPYDVPKYSASRGIVRKCDMCYSRLSQGESPACVDACPHEAIKIVVISEDECRSKKRVNSSLVPASPKSGYTIPATTYLSSRALPSNLMAADSSAIQVQQAHWPLVFMLTLTQLGLGGFFALLVLEEHLSPIRSMGLTWTSWIAFHIGLAVSIAHLGQLLKAWRIFLGIRKSWLSREALVFGTASAASSLLLVGKLAELDWLYRTSSIALLALGILATFCSAYLYHDTRRKFWRLSMTLSKFFGTIALGGLGLAVVFSSETLPCAVDWLLIVSVVKIWIEWRSTWYQGGSLTSRLLIVEHLNIWWRSRLILTGAGIGALGLAMAQLVHSPLGFVIGAVGVLFIGELVERALFFKSVDVSKMPGGFN